MKKKVLEIAPEKIENEPLSRKLKRLRSWSHKDKCRNYNYKKRQERSLKRMIGKYLVNGKDVAFENYTISEIVKHIDSIKPDSWEKFEDSWTIVIPEKLTDLNDLKIKHKK